MVNYIYTPQSDYFKCRVPLKQTLQAFVVDGLLQQEGSTGLKKGKDGKGYEISFGKDSLPGKILQIIMKNARIPSKDVAVECGVSRAAIHQRIQRMIDMNVITGSGYNVDPRVLGYATCTYIGVKLERGSMYRDVVPELEKIREVVECHFTTGPYTMLIKLYARDNQHLMELLNDKIQHIPGVNATETLISLEMSINREIPVNFDSGE